MIENLSQYLIYALIGLPIIAALFMLPFKKGLFRNIFTYLFAIVIAISSVVLIAINIGVPYTPIEISEDIVHMSTYIGLGLSCIIGLTIIIFGIKYKNIIAIVLAVIQLACSLYIELCVAPDCEPTSHLYFDPLTLLMAVIIGVIGSGICIYALGYMKDHNKHLKDGEKNRSNVFFALMFVFLSAMFLIVFSNNLIWMFTG